jgi:hypothetical protein
MEGKTCKKKVREPLGKKDPLNRSSKTKRYVQNCLGWSLHPWGQSLRCPRIILGPQEVTDRLQAGIRPETLSLGPETPATQKLVATPTRKWQ